MPAPETAVAGPAASRDLAAVVERMLNEARAGEWQRVGHDVAQLRSTIDALSPAERGEGIRAAIAGIERVTALAVARRGEIAERLSSIRHGRKAAASYRAHRG